MSKELEQNIIYLKRIITIMVVLLALLFIANVITFTKFKPHGQHQPTKEFALLDPAREFTPQENYITNIQELRNYLNELGGQYPDTVSIYYEQLNSGANISVNKNLRLFPASLSKLVQAIIVAKKVEDGIWSWDKTFAVDSSDLNSESGELYKTIGTEPQTLETLVEEMITNSDNTAQNIIRRNLVVADYLAFQSEVGLEDLYNDQGYVSAKEYSRVLRVLYTSSFLKRSNSEKILEYMANSNFHDYLSQGLPTDMKFAHKYGENREQSIFADSGIVYVKDKPYMITVLLKGKDSTDETRQWAVNLMKEISIKAYEAGK